MIYFDHGAARAGARIAVQQPDQVRHSRVGKKESLHATPFEDRFQEMGSDLKVYRRCADGAHASSRWCARWVGWTPVQTLLARPAGRPSPARVVLVQHRSAAGRRPPGRPAERPVVVTGQRAGRQGADRSRGTCTWRPADYHLFVERGFLSLSIDQPVLFARPSIDVLFESVADSYGAGAVAVMLTRSNDDGASGAHAVKRCGGKVLVQDPATARAPAGPLAVLGRVAVDGMFPVAELATHLVGLCGGAHPPRP